MKIKLFIIFLIFIQAGYSQGFKAGFLVGGIVSQVDGDESGGYNKIGFQAGLYSNYFLNDKWSILAELKFIQKGSSKTVKNNPYAYFKISLNYIEIPLILNYHFREKFNFGIGLSYGQLIKAKVEDSSGPLSKDRLTYKSGDVNGIGQIKFFFNKHLWIDVKFAYSIVTITKVAPFQRSKLISFGLGYEF